MSSVQEFYDLRPWLFAIAYRLLGSVADAEDAIQETWLRLERTDDEPASLKAYLSTVITRICIDSLRSAQHRRETYVGPWFPEPLPTDGDPPPFADPERAAELAESVSVAALLLLERLSPLERAVYVLHDVFEFTFDEIAAMVDRSAPACRQLGSRARKHMAEGRPRFDADAAQRRELADRFFDALRDGEVEPLQELLAAEVAAINDGAGEGGGAGGTFDRERAAKALVAAVTPLLQVGGRLEPRELNGQPGAILHDLEDRIVGTWTLEIVAGEIRTIHSVTSKHKLTHLGEPGDLRALRETARASSRAERG